jgi:hypothetical protein
VKNEWSYYSIPLSGFGGLGVSVLASGTQARGIFKGGKILSTPSLGREVKPWVPCRRFAAFKKIPKGTVEVGILGKIIGPYSRP